MATDMEEHDPIKNPRPEDLHAYGIGNALAWFAVLLAIGLGVYYMFLM